MSHSSAFRLLLNKLLFIHKPVPFYVEEMRSVRCQRMSHISAKHTGTFEVLYISSLFLLSSYSPPSILIFFIIVDAWFF